jgi:hypothetical protein
MKTVILHFRNEEYILRWWLNHHKKIFDNGILIDYNSSDNSAYLCKKICPHWKLVKSKNKFFEAHLCDQEVMEYEQSIEGYRIALTATEFMIGNFSKLNKVEPHRLVVKSYIMADPISIGENEPTYDKPLHEQNYYGYFDPQYRSGRLISNYPNIYNPGRHFYDYNTDDFAILFYAFSPWNDHTILRKLQVQTNIPNSDYHLGRGLHHRTSVKELRDRWKIHADKSVNLQPIIKNLTQE